MLYHTKASVGWILGFPSLVFTVCCPAHGALWIQGLFATLFSCSEWGCPWSHLPIHSGRWDMFSRETETNSLYKDTQRQMYYRGLACIVMEAEKYQDLSPASQRLRDTSGITPAPSWRPETQGCQWYKVSVCVWRPKSQESWCMSIP